MPGRVLLLLFLMVASTDIGSAGTRIENLMMEVDSRGQAAITVTNVGGGPMAYVLTPYEWTVENGQDVHRQTGQLMAAPTRFQLAPGQTMTVRVGLPDVMPAPLERAWRLSVREVPPQTGDRRHAFAFNHVLPLYVAPRNGTSLERDLTWSLRRAGNGWVVRIMNNGNRRQAIDSLTVGGRQVDTRTQATILAKSWRQFDLPPGAVRNSRARVEVRYLGGPSQTLTLSAG